MDRPTVTVPVLSRRVRLAGGGLVALAILVASVVDPPGTGLSAPVLGVPRDKVFHALAYAALASALVYAGLTPAARPSRRVLVVALCVAVAYGAAIEGVQAFLPTRAFDPLDALANAVGATVGTVPWRWVRPRRDNT